MNKSIKLNEGFVDVEYNVTPAEDNWPEEPSFPEEYEIIEVRYKGIDVLPILPSDTVDEITSKLD